MFTCICKTLYVICEINVDILCFNEYEPYKPLCYELSFTVKETFNEDDFEGH